MRVSCQAVGLAVLCGLLSGCWTTTQPRYYALQPLPAVYASPDRQSDDKGPSIGVGPVVTAKYLDHSQIAVVAGGTEVYFSEFNRWASPVGENITRVLVQNLGSLLSTSRVLPFPWVRNARVDCGVVVNVRRFDGEPGGKAVLDAQWSIFRADGTEPELMRSIVIERAVAAKSYAALVEAESALLGDLSRQIADDVRATERDRAPPSAP